MKATFIAGPCVIESAELLDTVAKKLVDINNRLGTDIIFKASFDKANRTSIHSFRGPGIDRGLQMLADVKTKYGLRLLTDIHEAWQAKPTGEVVDIIQIPAFLCRQTDLLVAAAQTGRIVNIKKAQFLSGQDMRYPVEKAREAGATDVWLIHTAQWVRMRRAKLTAFPLCERWGRRQARSGYRGASHTPGGRRSHVEGEGAADVRPSQPAGTLP